MSYTIIDLLDKFISIEQNGYDLYMEIASNESATPKIRTIARVFAKEEERHITVYKRLKDKAAGRTDISVDLDLYDKAAKVVNDYKKLNKKINAKEPNKFLEFCLNFEKENLALVLSIRGILVRSQEDMESKNYKILSEIINEEQSHIKNIEMFLK